jgi:hypothetical protein
MSTTYRIHWTPGTDRLLAVCHCASFREVEDPVAAWEWLLAHPHGHTNAPASRAPDRPAAAPTR